MKDTNLYRPAPFRSQLLHSDPPIQFPAYGLGEQRRTFKSLGLCTHMGAPGSQFWISPALATAGVNQQMESISVSLKQIAQTQIRVSFQAERDRTAYLPTLAPSSALSSYLPCPKSQHGIPSSLWMHPSIILTVLQRFRSWEVLGRKGFAQQPKALGRQHLGQKSRKPGATAAFSPEGQPAWESLKGLRQSRKPLPLGQQAPVYWGAQTACWQINALKNVTWWIQRGPVICPGQDTEAAGRPALLLLSPPSPWHLRHHRAC